MDIKVGNIVVKDYVFVNGDVCVVKGTDEVTNHKHVYIGALIDGTSPEEYAVKHTVQRGQKFDEDELERFLNRLTK